MTYLAVYELESFKNTCEIRNYEEIMPVFSFFVLNWGTFYSTLSLHAIRTFSRCDHSWKCAIFEMCNQ